MGKTELLSHRYSKKATRVAQRALASGDLGRETPFPMPTVKADQRGGASATPARRRAARRRSEQQGGVPVRRPGMSPGVFAGAVTADSRATAAYQADVTETVAGYDRFPYSAVGKMFFFSDDGDAYVGSAWLVGRRGIVTAAHCLYFRDDEEDRDAWHFYKNMTFAPAYNGDATGQEEFALEEATVDARYADDRLSMSEYLRWDIGVATLSVDLSDRFGYLGYDASGAVEAEKIEAVGYPAQSRPIPPRRNGGFRDFETYPFNGKQMWRSEGDYLGVEGDVHAVANEMTGGCSGGPMVVGEGDTAVGLNSHRLVPHDNRMFSPIFDDDFLALLEWLDEREAL